MRRLTAALALALLLPVPALAGQITVRPGETLSEIADRLGVSLTRLMQLNGISRADHVEAGQVLKVPGSAGGGGSAGAAASTSGQVTVREGDTLSEIADRNGVSLQQLMSLNGLSSADHIEVGQVLRVRGKRPAAAAAAAPTYRRDASDHVVRPGESLSEIADVYGISMSKLVAINAIDDPDHVEAGSRLKLRGEPVASRPRPAAPRMALGPEPASGGSSETSGTPRRAQAANGETPSTAPRSTAVTTTALSTTTAGNFPGSFSTTASPTPADTPAARPLSSSRSLASAGGTRAATSTPATTMATTPVVAVATPAASPVSRAVATPLSRTATTAATAPLLTSTRAVTPASAAATSRPISSAAAGMPLTAPQTSTSGWRRYGPLQVDWSNWQPMGGSLVAPILTAKGDTLYLAINCTARKLNATSVNGDWRTWDDPQADFERRLVNDLCSARS